jgi:cytochrome c5
MKTFAGLLIVVMSWQRIMADAASDTAQGSEPNPPSGKVVFQTACFSCHGTGFYGAPVIGDTRNWDERLAKGKAALLESTLEGMNSMPARGGCVDCSDVEIRQAVHYLIERSITQPQ